MKYKIKNIPENNPYTNKVMEEVTKHVEKYISPKELSKASFVSASVLTAQHIANSKSVPGKTGLKWWLKMNLVTVLGITCGSILHDVVNEYLFPVKHTKSSATKAGIEKESDTSGM